MGNWYHDKRAGLVKEEGKPGYICRGFQPEHGDLLAAAPDLREACKRALRFIKNGIEYDYISMPEKDDPASEVPHILAKALAKAEGRR